MSIVHRAVKSSEDWTRNNSDSLRVPLTLAQMRVILEALDRSRRALAPIGGIGSPYQMKSFNECVERIKHGISILARIKNAQAG